MNSIPHQLQVSHKSEYIRGMPHVATVLVQLFGMSREYYAL